MATRNLWIGLTGVILFSSCGSARVPVQPNDLILAFDLSERRIGTKSTIQPRGTLVDYESMIISQPDRAALARAAGIDRPGPPSPKIAKIESQLTAAGATLDRLLVSVASFERESLEFFTRGLEPGQVIQDDARWRSFTQTQLDIVKKLATLITSYVSARDYEGRWDPTMNPFQGLDNQKELLAALAKRRSIYGKIAPNGKEYRTQELRQFVDQYMSLLQSQIVELELEILDEAKTAADAELQMEAALIRGGQRLAVTISPYTTVEGVDRGKKSDRVGIPSTQDLARVEKQFAAYGNVADSLNSVIEIAGDKKAREALAKGIVAALETAMKQLEIGMREELRKLIASQETALDPVKAEARALSATIDVLLGIVRGIQSRSNDPIALADQVVLALGKFDEFKTELGKFQTNLENLIATLASESAAIRVANSLKSAVGSAATQFVDKVLTNPQAGAIAGLFTNLKALQVLARLESFGDVKAGKITKQPFQIRQAPTGVVNLADTPAEPGDKLGIWYTLSIKAKKVPGGRNTPGVHQEASTFLDVRKFGYYTTYSAQLLFFDRQGDGSSTFRAAPGIGYNMHYRPDSDSPFWDIVAPGLGISVSSPSFDNGTEIAIGAHVTLLNDMIQLGYARNISVETQPNMYYFALDLIKIFQASSK